MLENKSGNISETRKDRGKVTISQVHYVQKKTFVQNLRRFANLYILGKLIMPGVQKIMFRFAQPPLTLVANFAMATKIWEFQHKISCIWGNIRDYN